MYSAMLFWALLASGSIKMRKGSAGKNESRMHFGIFDGDWYARLHGPRFTN